LVENILLTELVSRQEGLKQTNTTNVTIGEPAY